MAAATLLQKQPISTKIQKEEEEEEEEVSKNYDCMSSRSAESKVLSNIGADDNSNSVCLTLLYLVLPPLPRPVTLSLLNLSISSLREKPLNLSFAKAAFSRCSLQYKQPMMITINTAVNATPMKNISRVVPGWRDVIECIGIIYYIIIYYNILY